MQDILVGAVAMASVVAGMFFFLFWRDTRDRFFLFFAFSFWADAASRLYAVLSGVPGDDSPGAFLIRFIAYSLILLAILDKNRPRRRT